MGLETINNLIHPTAIVGDNVTLGNNNYIGPFCYITSNTIIGDNNRFEAYCSVGTPAENKEYLNSFDGKLIIGNNNVFREYTSINAGSTKLTIIGNDNLLLRNVYIAHDSIIEDNTILSGNILIGGYSYIMSGVNMGMGSIAHQFSKIGAYSMIGMGSVITKTSKIIPGGVYYGLPSKYKGKNEFGLKKYNIDEKQLKDIIDKFNNIILSK